MRDHESGWGFQKMKNFVIPHFFLAMDTRGMFRQPQFPFGREFGLHISRWRLSAFFIPLESEVQHAVEPL